MKKITLLLLFTLLSFFVNAQSYIGFLSDNYSGVHGVISNPANIVDSRFKTDINLAGFSAFGGNDYYGINVFDAFKEDYNFDLESKKSPSESNSGAINIDVLGPSFMFNLSKNSSIAIFTRGRFFTNIYGVNGASIASIDDDATGDFNLNEGDINVLAHGWAEAGITYARVLLNKQRHFFKGGLSLKYLQGLGSAYVTGDNVTVNYDADGTDLGGGETTGSISSTGFINYARHDEFDNDGYDYEVPNNANGFGVDLGFVYEWRPNYADYQDADSESNAYAYKDKNKYKLKLGVSITDIGFVDYKEGIKEAYNIDNSNISEDDFDDSDDIGTFLNTYYTFNSAGVGYKMDLPTVLHFNVDWSLNRKLYINVNTDFSLISKGRISGNRITNIVSLTPRFESKWFSFYVPLSAIETNGFRVGAGLRAGPLYIGSGSVVSAFTSNDNKEADIYAGLKIPVYQGGAKDKDKDKDGIIDTLDACPKEAGPIENNGCPWGDSDEDGLLDNVDACPKEAGSVENNGCPWGDKDGDSILDNVDACPDLYGLKIYNGCPFKDTDGDGVYDKDDVCIDEAGSAANNGCPEEVIEKLQNTLNGFAKVIPFDHGKSTLKVGADKVLFEIIEVLNKYPSARFTIEGHTDSIGSYKLNQWLSEARANAVRDFLVEKGIDSSRLIAIGYGERKPIATNMYRDGRAQNRRVEINLIK
jgi:outer membrane protein OmpA-like peptidoglycan-associated protein